MRTINLIKFITPTLGLIWVMTLFDGFWAQTTNTRSTKFLLQSFKPFVNSLYIKEFRRISPEDNIYKCILVKDLQFFYIDVIVNHLNKDREVYGLKNVEGCVFLTNPLLNRIFYSFFEKLVLNHTPPMRCPIKKGTYLFRNAFSKSVLPQIHPKGNFSLNFRFKANNDDQIILDLQWIYRVSKKT